MILLNYLLITGCFIAAFYYPTKQGKIAASIFTLSFASATFVDAPVFFLVSALGMCLGIIVLQRWDNKYVNNLKCWLIVGMVLDIFGLIAWYGYFSIYVSNYIFDLTGISLVGYLGELYLYNLLSLVYNVIALFKIVDIKGRGKVAKHRVRFLSHTYDDAVNAGA